MATRNPTAPAGAHLKSVPATIRAALSGMEEVSAILLTARRALDLNDEAAEERATLTVADRRLTEVHDALERADRAESTEVHTPADALDRPAMKAALAACDDALNEGVSLLAVTLDALAERDDIARERAVLTLALQRIEAALASLDQALSAAVWS